MAFTITCHHIRQFRIFDESHTHSGVWRHLLRRQKKEMKHLSIFNPMVIKQKWLRYHQEISYRNIHKCLRAICQAPPNRWPSNWYAVARPVFEIPRQTISSAPDSIVTRAGLWSHHNKQSYHAFKWIQIQDFKPSLMKTAINCITDADPIAMSAMIQCLATLAASMWCVCDAWPNQFRNYRHV